MGTKGCFNVGGTNPCSIYFLCLHRFDASTMNNTEGSTEMASNDSTNRYSLGTPVGTGLNCTKS